jgi:predicted GTPase
MTAAGRRRRIVIMGAGGRDFHDFNMLFRTDPGTEVVAFTAAQIPFQRGRRYPTALAGPLYPKGIAIVGEEDLPALIRRRRVDEVILAYSDLSHRQVMAAASRVLALGADFRLIGPERTMLKARLPVISVCAVRTGCGKSPVTRFLCRLLLDLGRRPVVIRHPMAYGRLSVREVEDFRAPADLDRFQCTLEEREEYEPLIALGVPLFAGVDYQMVLRRAQQAGDVLLWDGGNNDFPFLRPDLEITLVDPLRAGDEVDYYPGLVNLLRAEVVIVAKADAATPAALETVLRNVAAHNPNARLVRGALEVAVDAPEVIRGQRVAVVEDGPTLTHGGMAFGAGTVAARRFGAREIIDPRPWAVGSLVGVFRDFPHIGRAVPAMGYSVGQLADLQATLEAIPCDLIVSATPVDLGPVLRLSRPVARVTYEFRELDDHPLAETMRSFLGRFEERGARSKERGSGSEE